MIDIKDKNGNLRYSVEITDKCVYYKALMEEEYVLLSLDSDTLMPFAKGDYIETEFGTFYAVYIDKPKRTSNGGYSYEQKFHAPWEWLRNRIAFYDRQKGSEKSWKMTQRPEYFLDIITGNISEAGYGDYSFDVDENLTEMKLVEFDATNIIDALTAVAQAWQSEWWISNNVIHLSKCEYGNAVTLQLDDTLSDIERDNGQDSSYATRLFAFGSSRNLQKDYRKDDDTSSVVEGVVETRLKLPAGTPYVDAWENMQEEDIVEGVAVFDDIYPRRTGTIASISTKQYTDTVDNGDGTTTQEKWNAFRFTDTGITFSSKYVIEGEELRIVFQTGKLAGMDFAVTFNPDGLDETDSKAQVFEIVRNEDYGLPLPADDFKPSVGDTYILYGYDISLVEDALIPAAEQELLEAAKEYIKEISQDTSVYTCKTNPIRCAGYKDNGTGKLAYNEADVRDLDVGQTVKLVDDNYFPGGFRVSRVRAFEKRLDNKFTCTYTIGESSVYSSRSEMQQQIDELTYKSKNLSNSYGKSVYLITRYDKTVPSDSNAFSAKRSQHEFLQKNVPDSAKEKISFEKGIDSGNFKTGSAGWEIDEQGNLEVLSALVRNLLKIGEDYSITSAGKAVLGEIVARAIETKTLDVTQAANIVLNLLKTSDFVTGSLGKGVAIYKNGNSWKMEIDELLVRKIATFLKLEIRELSYVGGNIVLSKAGNEITAVEKVGGGWKCSFTSNEGDEVQNFWKAGDQARCQKFDVAEGTNESVQSKYYWRLVTEVGKDYVVLSETDYDTGVTNSEPAAGDKIVQMGFRLSGDEGDKDRTSLIILSTSGENTPSIEAYTGVTAYELSAEKRLFILSPGEVSFRSDLFRWMSGGVKFPQEVYRGDWESGTAYNYYDKVTHNGSTWICIATEVTSSEPAKGNAAWKEYAEKGADGTAGKGIKSITEYYLATSAGSGVSTGTAGWTTAVQTITATKRYLWNYEVVGYTDGSSTKSTPVVIGVYGEKGEAGTSVTVSSTTITYAAGTNGTTPPSSGWSEKVPAVSAGQYLWGKTVVAYSDGKSTTTYSVSYQGTDGQPGDDGTSVTITGHETRYAVTTTAGQPADSAFTSETIPALSPGDYLWSRTTVTYSGGVQTKSYAVSRIGTDGTDGQPGSDGKNSYTHFAYASSADGATGFSTTYFEGALYLGTCSDFNEADPEDYKAYSWARMKGEAGAVGETLLGGKMLFTDPEFKDGENGIAKYSNGTAENKAKLVVERISTSELADVPTQSGYCIRVTVGAAQSPGHGGVIQRIESRPGAVFVQKVIAKIPSGYTLESTSNQMGTGYKQEFLTSRAGTGKYETYLIKTTCGAAGSFSTGGHIYINGGNTPTEAAPLVWYIAYMTAFDLTADGYGQITDEINASLAKTVQVTADGQVFRYGAGYTGNPFPASITLTAEAKNFEPKSWQWQYLDSTSWKTISNATGSTYIVEPGNTTLFGTGVYVRTLRCVCDGDESKSDTFTLAKLADGAPGAAGADAYTVLLTNEAHTFEGGETAAKAAVTSFLVQAYKGAEMVRATIGEITGIPSGMTVQLSENGSTTPSATITVTEGMDTLSGSLDVPITVDGKVFKKRFSWSVALQGGKGNPGTDGTKIIPAELTTAFNATYVQWLTLYNQTVGKVWNVDNASDYRVGDIAVITGNVTDRGNIKASLYASVLTVNTAAGTIGTRSYSLVVGNQGEQGSSGVDAKRNLLMNSGVEQTGTAYLVRSDLFITPSEGYVLPGTHTGSLIEGEKYTAVVCFTPNAAGKSLILYHLGTTQLATWSVESTAERQIFKKTFTFSYGAGYDPRPTTDGGDGYAYFFMRLYYGSSSDHPGGTVHWIKLVKGETATDEWTPAPEDSNNFDVQVSPSALSFKTDEDDGSVIYSGNTATLTATHGGQPAKVSYVSSSAQLTGLTGLQNSGSGTETMKVTLTGISYTTQELKVPNGTGYDTKQMQIPVTSGQAAFKVQLTYAGYTEERTITVPFTVDVKASLVSFGTTANSIVGQVWDTNGVVSRLSKVEQTAGSITSTVESMLASSPNLLDGSKLRLVTTGESRHLYVRLTAGKWYMFSARAMINSTLLNGSQKLLVSCYETNPNGGWGANHTMVFDNTSWEIKKLDVSFQAQYTSVAHVYAVTINSDGKGEAAVSGGAGFVDWVQLEECEENSTVATAWKPSANDNVVRPSLLNDEDWTYYHGTEQIKDYELADGTKGTVNHCLIPDDDTLGYADVIRTISGITPYTKPKTQYTISVWAKGKGSIKMYLIAPATGSINMDGKGRIDIDGECEDMALTGVWKKYESTVTTSATVDGGHTTIALRLIGTGCEVWCYGAKVEQGGTATDSSLIDSVSGNFKSEIKQTADEINLSVEDVKTGVEAVGIELDGKNSTITLTGKKVKIEEGAEFNANNATFKNIKVEGILSSVVSTTGYDDRNYFIGDDCIPGAPLNILVTKMNDNAAGTEQHLFLPCDYDFIGSHVMILADNISDSAGKINAQTLYTRIYSGRNYMKHAYLTQGQGTSAAPYKISQEMLVVNDSAYAGTGDMLRDTYQQVFSGAQFFGRWTPTAGTGTEGDDISGSYAPDRISIVSGYIEFVGVPAPTANAILFPYKVELQTDNSGAQTDDSNSHLLKVSYVSKTVHFPVAMYGGSVVQDELYNKLKNLYDEKGQDGLPTGVTALGLKYFQYYNPTKKSVEKEYKPLFSVPLCRWYPTSLSALTSTAERSSSAGNNTSVEGAVYQS